MDVPQEVKFTSNYDYIFCLILVCHYWTEKKNYKVWASCNHISRINHLNINKQLLPCITSL